MNAGLVKAGTASKLLRLLRRLVGTLFIVAGLLIIVASLMGSEPIRINAGRHTYYRLVADPPPHLTTVGTIAILLGVLIAFLPSWLRNKGR